MNFIYFELRDEKISISNSMIYSDIWHKYQSWYFKIVSNFTCLTAREIMYNNFEISLMVFKPNITTIHAIAYTSMVIPS